MVTAAPWPPTTPGGAAFRGYGGPESEFPSEVLMDELAEKLGMDPFDLRELNCYKGRRHHAYRPEARGHEPAHHVQGPASQV